ncbi:MAG: ABC transporter ATP-binding protein [Comamonadaceae bacterium]|jgi:peptide/nickel transport system ATP-binding protein|nr:ABC transporter ATP-binding protein [Comamonadaceae bacterium]
MATRRPPPPIAQISDNLLEVKNLTVDFISASKAPVRAVEEVSFVIPRERTVALVGESGSGKSVSALAIMGLLPPQNAKVALHSAIEYDNRSLLNLSRSEWQLIRGSRIAMIFQDPMTSLNPVYTVGFQLAEMLKIHKNIPNKEAAQRACDLLEEVGIPEPRKRVNAYPHELSGGQQQRVMIAMALACEPELLIADEPTTALDVTVQRQILLLLAELRERRRMAMLFITHDLGLVSEVADQAVVMRKGTVREAGPVRTLFTQPQDPYTKALLSCRPSVERQGQRLLTIDDWMSANSSDDVSASAAPSTVEPIAVVKASESDKPLLEVQGLRKVFKRSGPWFQSDDFVAVENVSFQLKRGQTVGLVGESGSGKTTVGLCLLRLHEATAGKVLYEGKNLLEMSNSEFATYKRRLQIVFQNPYASLNPRFTVGEILSEPMQLHGIGQNSADWEKKSLSLLDKVGMPASALKRYPFEFSGGQRQRIAIARSLSLSPEVVVLDEAVSALDVSVQAQVLNLLKDLQKDLGLSYLFISHDLEVVRYMSDSLLVMNKGQVVEQGDAASIYQQPQHAYTQTLLAAVPKLQESFI